MTVEQLITALVQLPHDLSAETVIGPVVGVKEEKGIAFVMIERVEPPARLACEGRSG